MGEPITQKLACLSHYHIPQQPWKIRVFEEILSFFALEIKLVVADTGDINFELVQGK